MTNDEIEKLRQEQLNIQAELILGKFKPELKETILSRITSLNEEIRVYRDNDYEKDITYYTLVECCYTYYYIIEVFF
jgi:hypothetical protein